ncbi:MAG: hypothetical protein ABIR18_05590 [Chitinophagaceae bacterium]
MQMHPSYKKNIITVIAISIASLPVFSQNMNSPYSVYGIGDIDHKMYNRTSGMGGTGLAIRSTVSFIDNNPAAITGLPRSFYMAHVAVTGKTSTYTGDPIDASNSNNKDMWIKRFALAVKINNYWASSIGFGQFSSINYKFNGNKFIEGSNNSYQIAREGDGGLNDYHWTNAFSLGRHLSIGVKSSILAGAINQTETLSDEALQSTIVSKQQDYIGDLHFQGGILFETALNKKWDFSIGGKYAPKTKFSSQRTLTVTENEETIKEDEYIKSERFYLPPTFAGGLAFKHNKKTTFAVDYTHEDWSSLKVKENGWQLINSDRVSAGIEFSRFRNKQGQEVDYKFFQFGGYYSNSYLQVRNKPIKEYGLTIGTGGLIANGVVYTLSAEGGIKGTTQAKLIKETWFGFTLNITYSDLLFSKGRRYD